MSLQITFTDPESDVVYENSYHKIIGFSDDRINKIMQIHVRVYKDSAAKDADKWIRQNGAAYLVVMCTQANYESFFLNAELGATEQTALQRLSELGYEFLKTQDAATGCQYDYKNSSSDV